MPAPYDLTMTFSPSIDVLSEQPPVLESPDLSWAAVNRYFGLDSAAAVCLTGSIQAGWGNVYSDIDLFVFSETPPELPSDSSVELWPGSDKSGLKWMKWIGRYHDSCVDMTIWSPDAVETALAPFLGSEEPEFCTAGDAVEDFLYRVSIARPLSGESFLRSKQKVINDSSYRAALARFMKVYAENALIDVAGQLEVGDEMSARATAMMAARQATDACLIISGELCRREKWILRRLERAPQCGITVDEYRDMVIGGLRDGESDADCARRIARWTQAQLVRFEDAILGA